MPQCTKHLSGKKNASSITYYWAEENLERYNNINSNTEKPLTVSELKPESLIYFSILLGWWQLKQPGHNSATGCSKMSPSVLVLPAAEAEDAPPYPLLYLHVHFGSLPEKSTFSCCYGNCNICWAAAVLRAKLAPPIVSSVCVFLNTALVTADYCICSVSLKVQI